jgi:GTP cyclohydrolase II
LHWLGITKIDRFLSMSHHKYDAIVQSGIQVLERVEIPETMIPEDSRVEIDAKIASGYYAHKKVTEVDLINTKGRTWDDINH